MRRAAGLPRLLARAFTTSTAPARDSSGQQAVGFPAWLGEGASTRLATPLTKPLPGTAQRNGYAVPLQPPPTEITTLPNGVRIVSEASTVGGGSRRSARAARRAAISAVPRVAPAATDRVPVKLRSGAVRGCAGHLPCACRRQTAGPRWASPRRPSAPPAGPHFQPGDLCQLWQHLRNAGDVGCAPRRLA
jgi:hypothetical protein